VLIYLPGTAFIPRLRSGCFDKISISACGSDAAQSPQFRQRAQFLACPEQLTAAKSAAQKAIMQRQIDATDAEIDNLVCELYGITDGERKIIEEQH
jgi:hypothetical protein